MDKRLYNLTPGPLPGYSGLRRWPGLLVLCTGMLLSHISWAVPPVEALALFKNMAVVRGATGQETLKVGETSPSGLTLLAATPNEARIRYDGEEYILTLSSRVASAFSSPEQTHVRVTKDSLGQYRVRGAMNGHYVNFLVDTGASVVAMSERQALSMGLDYRSGELGSVQTAQGNATAYFTKLNNVTVGGIELSQVEATIIEGNYPVDVLLGMSFLGRLSMQESAGVLTITAKF